MRGMERLKSGEGRFGLERSHLGEQGGNIRSSIKPRALEPGSGVDPIHRIDGWPKYKSTGPSSMDPRGRCPGPLAEEAPPVSSPASKGDQRSRGYGGICVK